MKKRKIIEVILLSISIALFVSIFGTFHETIGIQKAWIAFLSAAIFFAAGHKLNDSINITLSHLLGVGWGMAILYLFEQHIINIDGALYIFLILSIFGFMSAIATNIGINFLSHTPSLFCGWAIAFAVFGGVSIAEWTAPLISDVLLSCIAGVFFIGVGISQLQCLLAKIVLRNVSITESTEIKNNKSYSKKIENNSLADEKMQYYLKSYVNYEIEASDNREEMQKLRVEIEKLHQSLLDTSHTKRTTSNEVISAKVKIIGICGSPHKKGSTIEYLRMAMSAVEKIENVETEIIELAGKEIKPCLGCKSDKCGGTCVISDYMQELYPKLRICDGIILASPSYFGTFSSQLKLFIDRLRVMRHSNFELGNVVVGTIAVAGRRHGGQEITNIDLIQSMMRHNTIIVNDCTAVCQLGATGWSHTFDDPTKKTDTDEYGMQTAVGVGRRVAEIAKIVKASGLQNTIYEYNQKIGKR
jgi:multimeric flavodoxin WrbA